MIYALLGLLARERMREQRVFCAHFIPRTAQFTTTIPQSAKTQTSHVNTHTLPHKLNVCVCVSFTPAGLYSSVYGTGVGFRNAHELCTFIFLLFPFRCFPLSSSSPAAAAAAEAANLKRSRVCGKGIKFYRQPPPPPILTSR